MGTGDIIYLVLNGRLNQNLNTYFKTPRIAWEMKYISSWNTSSLARIADVGKIKFKANRIPWETRNIQYTTLGLGKIQFKIPRTEKIRGTSRIKLQKWTKLNFGHPEWDGIRNISSFKILVWKKLSLKHLQQHGRRNISILNQKVQAILSSRYLDQHGRWNTLGLKVQAWVKKLQHVKLHGREEISNHSL